MRFGHTLILPQSNISSANGITSLDPLLTPRGVPFHIWRPVIQTALLSLVVMTICSNLAIYCAYAFIKVFRKSISNLYILSLATADLLIGCFAMTYMAYYTLTLMTSSAESFVHQLVALGGNARDSSSNDVSHPQNHPTQNDANTMRHKSKPYGTILSDTGPTPAFGPFSGLACGAWQSLDFICSCASMYSVCGIALDRWFHLEKPLRVFKRSRRSVRYAIALIWGIPILVWVLTYTLLQDTVQQGSNIAQNTENLTGSVTNKLTNGKYGVIPVSVSMLTGDGMCYFRWRKSLAVPLLSVFVFYVPVVILIVVLLRIICLIRGHVSFMHRHTTTSTGGNTSGVGYTTYGGNNLMWQQSQLQSQSPQAKLEQIRQRPALISCGSSPFNKLTAQHTLSKINSSRQFQTKQNRQNKRIMAQKLKPNLSFAGMDEGFHPKIEFDSNSDNYDTSNRPLNLPQRQRQLQLQQQQQRCSRKLLASVDSNFSSKQIDTIPKSMDSIASSLNKSDNIQNFASQKVIPESQNLESEGKSVNSFAIQGSHSKLMDSVDTSFDTVNDADRTSLSGVTMASIESAPVPQWHSTFPEHSHEVINFRYSDKQYGNPPEVIENIQKANSLSNNLRPQCSSEMAQTGVGVWKTQRISRELVMPRQYENINGGRPRPKTEGSLRRKIAVQQHNQHQKSMNTQMDSLNKLHHKQSSPCLFGSNAMSKQKAHISNSEQDVQRTNIGTKLSLNLESQTQSLEIQPIPNQIITEETLQTTNIEPTANSIKLDLSNRKIINSIKNSSTVQQRQRQARWQRMVTVLGYGDSQKSELMARIARKHERHTTSPTSDPTQQLDKTRGPRRISCESTALLLARQRQHGRSLSVGNPSPVIGLGNIGSFIINLEKYSNAEGTETDLDDLTDDRLRTEAIDEAGETLCQDPESNNIIEIDVKDDASQSQSINDTITDELGTEMVKSLSKLSTESNINEGSKSITTTTTTTVTPSLPQHAIVNMKNPIALMIEVAVPGSTNVATAIAMRPKSQDSFGSSRQQRSITTRSRQVQLSSHQKPRQYMTSRHQQLWQQRGYAGRPRQKIEFMALIRGHQTSHRLHRSRSTGSQNSEASRKSTLTMLSDALIGSHGGSLASQIRASRAVIFILTAFLICWVPFIVMWPLKTTCPECISDAAYLIAIWANYANSTLNPIIYALCSPVIRFELARRFYEIKRYILRRRAGDDVFLENEHQQFQLHASSYMNRSAIHV